GAVVATIRRSPSRTTNTLPSSVAASSWVSVPPPGWTSAAASLSSAAARATSVARVSSASVEARTDPDSAKRTAVSICEEISVRSASAWAASIGLTLTHTPPGACPEESAGAEVLLRPGNAPRGDDRVLRAPVVRPAHVPRPLLSRSRTPRRRIRLLRQGAAPRVSDELAREHPHARPPRAGQRDRARDHRRCAPRLVVALALQRARVGVE